jgi:hypothetical protein
MIKISLINSIIQLFNINSIIQHNKKFKSEKILYSKIKIEILVCLKHLRFMIKITN